MWREPKAHRTWRLVTRFLQCHAKQNTPHKPYQILDPPQTTPRSKRSTQHFAHEMSTRHFTSTTCRLQGNRSHAPALRARPALPPCSYPQFAPSETLVRAAHLMEGVAHLNNLEPWNMSNVLGRASRAGRAQDETSERVHLCI